MQKEGGLRVQGFKSARVQGSESSNPSTLQPFNPVTSKWVHRLAVANAAATLLLLFVGGLVTSKGAGLAVPDWPTTFGYGMFFYPWSKMVGDIFYEHSHRLVASGVGFLTLALALLLWFYERRAWLRWLGAAALALVVVQGVVGGLRVVLLEGTLAIVHAGLAQVFFALSACLALFTSPEWSEKSPPVRAPDAARVRWLCVLTTALIYLQGFFGAVLRHTGAGLDIHLLFGALVAAHVCLLGARILRFYSDRPKLLRPVLLLGGLLIAQLALGLASYAGKLGWLEFSLSRPAVVFLTTMHVVAGALMLVTSLVLALRSYSLLSPPEPMAARGVLSGRLSA